MLKFALGVINCIVTSKFLLFTQNRFENTMKSIESAKIFVNLIWTPQFEQKINLKDFAEKRVECMFCKEIW